MRFASVGVCNTAIDTGLFLLLHARLGGGEQAVLLANLVSTSTGMLFSFVVNGLVTFGSQRLTLGHAVRFLAITGTTMWLLQPLVITAVEAVVGVLLVAKLAAIAVSLVVNFAGYRRWVWRADAPAPTVMTDAVTPPRTAGRA